MYRDCMYQNTTICPKMGNLKLFSSNIYIVSLSIEQYSLSIFFGTVDGFEPFLTSEYITKYLVKTMKCYENKLCKSAC